MRIVAVADMHGRLPDDIPECDVLLLPGDIAPDFPFHKTFWDPDLCRVEQMQWLSMEYFEWEKSVPAKRILATPGNHDWWSRMPEHCRTEVFIDQGVEVSGVSFWFTPWVNPIGSWNYMIGRGAQIERFAEIPPRVDVLVAHGPPFMTLDYNYSGHPCGSEALRAAIYEKKPAHVFFGHIHEGCRHAKDTTLGVSQLHHASWTSYNPPRLFNLFEEIA